MLAFSVIKQSLANYRAKWVQRFRAREVAKVLGVTHQRELRETPPSDWLVLKAKQAEEMRAVMAGKFDIVDRRTWALPFIPESLHRLNQPLLKATPYNLRRFSETPIARRAINLVKNGVLSLEKEIKIVGTPEDESNPELLKQKQTAEYVFEHPNNQDSYHTLTEAVLEDLIIGAYGCIEPRITPDYERPVKMWPVDGSSIRIFADWRESEPDRPHYAQLTGLKGERGTIVFRDDELVYIRDNVRSSTPFGLGKLEVAFLTLNSFLCAQDMAGRAGADQIHKTWLWWEPAMSPGQMGTVQRHIQNEAEGQAKISLTSGMLAPKVIEVQAVKEEDLLLNWQEFLIRIIGAAFDVSPQALGLEQHVNRATAQVMAQADFLGSVVPMARRLQEAYTRRILHLAMGFDKLRFEFIGMEDPDIITQSLLVRTAYSLNAMTSDEVRKKLHLGVPLPGGLGKLTSFQQQLILAQLTGKAPMGSGGGGGAGGGFGGGMGGGMGTGTGMSAASLADSPFGAQDVSGMTPQQIQQYQEAGLLPETQQLGQDMESQQPGILETVSEQLKEFFEYQLKEEEEDVQNPAKVTGKDKKGQLKKFQQRQKQVQETDRYARIIPARKVGGKARPGTPKGPVTLQ